MTVADITERTHKWIPRSWISNETIDRDRSFRDRDRDRDIDLDDTRSFRNRRYDDNSPSGPKVQVPFGVIITVMIYLIGQLVGGVWWAATLQTNLQHEIADRAKEEGRLWQTIETYRLQVEALRVEIARSGIKTNDRSRINLQEE